MEHIIHIAVQDKIATKTDRTVYICGNSDFVIDFDFDEEWAAYPVKTARLIDDDDSYFDVVFNGNICPVPVLSNTFRIRVGVFAGDLHTTTPAYVPAKKSILCVSGPPAAPAEDVYAQMMEILNRADIRNAVTDEEVLETLADEDLMVAVGDADGVLCDEENNVIEW
ncbi:MAG: hypothetical protein J6M47_02555 [Clostridia bacterium]|nr:hypothetical protein [Clostridia bacterium]